MRSADWRATGCSGALQRSRRRVPGVGYGAVDLADIAAAGVLLMQCSGRRIAIRGRSTAPSRWQRLSPLRPTSRHATAVGIALMAMLTVPTLIGCHRVADEPHMLEATAASLQWECTWTDGPRRSAGGLRCDGAVHCSSRRVLTFIPLVRKVSCPSVVGVCGAELCAAISIAQDKRPARFDTRSDASN